MGQQDSLPLTVPQVALRSGVSSALVRAWVATGQLAHYRLGVRPGHGKIVVRTEDLERFLESRRVEKAPESTDRPPGHAATTDPELLAFQRRFNAELAAKRRRREARRRRG